MHEAEFWETEGDKIRCLLCPHRCLIAPGKSGICRVRTNRDGHLIADSYSEVISVSLDPIEKKPLFHFYPGSGVLSIGPRGCNFSCRYCQNWQVSQNSGGTLNISPERLVEEASAESAVGIAYTYTEPIVAFEFVRDTAKLARSRGLKNILVTNGYILEEPLNRLIEVTDAMNIDLKSMDQDFYRKICGGSLDPVLNTIRTVANSTVHLELTNLIITCYNDSEKQVGRLVDFVASVDPDIPVHFSGYHPAYRFNAPPTPLEILLRAKAIADRSLKYVYIGNRQTETGRDTFCPKCGNMLVSRAGYSGSIVGITPLGVCSQCGSNVDIEGPWNT